MCSVCVSRRKSLLEIHCHFVQIVNSQSGNKYITYIHTRILVGYWTYTARGERSRSRFSGSSGATERWFTYKQHSMAPYLNVQIHWQRFGGDPIYIALVLFSPGPTPNDCFVALFCTHRMLPLLFSLKTLLLPLFSCVFGCSQKLTL